MVTLSSLSRTITRVALLGGGGKSNIEAFQWEMPNYTIYGGVGGGGG